MTGGVPAVGIAVSGRGPDRYSVEYDRHVVTLPAVKTHYERSRQGVIFDEHTAKAKALARQAGVRVAAGVVSFELCLVPRPDNDYNRWAVSISALPASGRSLDDRHLGFLYDSYLYKLGSQTLHELARYSDGEIRVTAHLARGGGELERLALPEAGELRRAIEHFISTRKPSAPASLPSLRELTGVDSLTDQVLDRLGTFAAPARAIGPLKVSTQAALGVTGDRRIRSLEVNTESDRQRLGKLVAGYLFLQDERDRPTVLSQLELLGVPAPHPAKCHPYGRNLRKTGQIPNMESVVTTLGVTFWPVNREQLGLHRDHGWLAIYILASKTLMVQDDLLVPPACVYAARIGLEVVNVRTPSVAWGMDENLVRTVAGAHEVVGRTLSWADVQPESQEFLTLERWVTSRSTVFPINQLSGRVQSCRVCRGPGAEFSTPICVAPLTYCQRCLDHAVYGASESIADAADGLRTIAKYEYAGRAPLESQIDSIRHDQPTPFDPSTVDELVMARLAIKRGRWPWTRLLVKAGLLGKEGFATPRGTILEAADGHVCLSMQEKAVDDFFHHHGIAHEREPNYPHDAELNPRTRRRADWLLADGTLVEMWGMPNDLTYRAKMDEKRTLAARHNIELVEFTLADIPLLPEIFRPWATGQAVNTTEWTPPPAKRSPRAGAGTGDARGGNLRNKEQRKARLERCRDAVRLQEAGLSQARIAQAIGVASGTVKVLLRDGKFYADPTSDPLRAKAAEAAVRARNRGLTKNQFNAELGLTWSKLSEAWKDAETLAPHVDPANSHPTA